MLNKFRGIKKSYRINVNDTTDNYYKTDKLCINKDCTILLINNYDHSKMFISIKFLYYTSKDCKYYGVDYEFNDYENYGYDYDNYDYDYDDGYYCVYNDNDFCDDNYCDNDYYDDYLYYKKPFNKFERLVFDKNNIVNLTNNDDNDTKPLLSAKKIALLIDNINIFIYEKRILN